MSEQKPDYERDVDSDTFEILQALVNQSQFLAILRGFHAMELDNLAIYPLTHFGWDDDAFLKSQKGVNELEIWGTWSDYDAEINRLHQRYLIGEIMFIPTSKKRANIIGLRKRQTVDGARVSDRLWVHLEKTLGVLQGTKTDSAPQQIPPEPRDKSDLYAWFDSMYECKKLGIRITLNDISEKVPYHYDTVRHRHTDYKIDRKNSTITHILAAFCALNCVLYRYYPHN